MNQIWIHFDKMNTNKKITIELWWNHIHWIEIMFRKTFNVIIIEINI